MIELRARLRELFRAPGYVAAVLFSLGVGMSVCVAVFSIVNTLVFAEVPGIGSRSTLVRLSWSDGLSSSAADLDAFEQRAAPSLEIVAGQADRRVAVALPTGPAVLPAAFVSRDFFRALATHAVAGRLLTAADAAGSAAPAAAISETLWRSAFGGTPDTIGRTITVAGHAFTIVGVTPEGFPGLDAADVGSAESGLPQVFVPLRFAATWAGNTAPTPLFVSIAGRLGQGVRLADVRRELAVVNERLATGRAVDRQRRSLRVFPMGLDLWDAPAESALVILVYLFVPIGVLAIGCGNVINLQMARAHERAGELSVRLALGASGARIARLLAIDILPIAVAAGVLGWVGARLLLLAAGSFVPLRFALDTRALGFAAVTVCGVTIVSGLLPAWLAARDVVAAGLRTPHGAPAYTRLRNLLVVVQVAGSVALMAIAALAARTLQSRAPVLPPDASSTLVAELDLADARPHEPRAALFVHTMLDTLASDGSVRAVGFSNFLVTGRPLRYRTDKDAPGVQRTVLGGVVTPGWFESTGARTVTGRSPVGPFDEAAVNEAFVTRNGTTPAGILGSRVRVSNGGAERIVEIVGVYAAPRFEANDHAQPMLLLSMPTIPPSSLVLTVRAADTVRARRAILAAAQRFDPALPFTRIETLDSRLDETVRGFRQMTVIAGALSAIALALASTGLYALMSYTVRRRTREIGIRIAVGAAPRDILALVVRIGSALVAGGGVLGLVAATPIAILMRSMFYGLLPWSPWIGLPTIGLLFVVASAAAFVPAWRAVRIDPLAVLREP